MVADSTFHTHLPKRFKFSAARPMKIFLQLLLCALLMACSTTKNLIDQRQIDLQDGFAAYEQGNYQQAILLLKPLAENGAAEAQTKLGSMYYLGFGVAEDDQEAAKWFKKAAQQGDLEAHVMLGTLYVLGAGVPQDDAAAADHFRVPAEWGIGGAQFILGILYMYGRGVPENKVEAYKWLSLSAERGSLAAREACNSLSRQMTEKEMAAATALIKGWTPRQTGGAP